MQRKSEIKLLKEKYLPGTRIRLLKMDDVQAPPRGTEGVVLGVDDAGSIIIRWDTNSSLNILPEIDEFEII